MGLFALASEETSRESHEGAEEVPPGPAAECEKTGVRRCIQLVCFLVIQAHDLENELPKGRVMIVERDSV